MPKTKEERRENPFLFCKWLFHLFKPTPSSACPKDCTQDPEVFSPMKKGFLVFLFPKPNTLWLGSCSSYPPTPSQPIISKRSAAFSMAEALFPNTLVVSSMLTWLLASKLPVHHQWLDLLYNVLALK